MDTKRIMIGDWVYNTYKKKNIQWTPQDFFMHINGHITDRIVLGRDIEPIPITPEILEKNGFEKRESERYKKSDDFYDMEVREYNDGLWILTLTDCEFTLPHSQVHVSYVHQLQQALRLYGIPEAIEL